MNLHVAFFTVSLNLAFCLASAQPGPAREPRGKFSLILANARVELSVTIDSNRIVSEQLSTHAEWSKSFAAKPAQIETDGGFSAEIMWTDWQAPKNLNNAENPVRLTQSEFHVDHHEFRDPGSGKKELLIDLSGIDYPLLARLRYRLDPEAFYVKKSLALSDTGEAGHFLQKICPVDGRVKQKVSVLKDGGFGQPVAFRSLSGGGFFGVEYPAADNVFDAKSSRIQCGHEVGEKINGAWVESETVVEGVSPTKNVKQFFMKYVDDIRITPLQPFTLYNSWYDLRSMTYPKVPEGNWMTEKNVFHMIDLIRRNMIEKHDIKLDAFVLDDGWDTYESDWVLNDKEFPRGLTVIADELKKTHTSLGMWLGPTGGYSFRMKRIDWMKAHGYEVVGHTRNTAMLCLAGRNYQKLFEKRVTDFADQGIGYFKWDGIQFSCSEPDHGHPVGIFSRRSVMESLISKCRAVRLRNPGMFLNITSGTWLSPWWVLYANTIWMQGADFGYADVPSISPRDAAITYRDFVLYDDFTRQKMWFPVANLMTHGIIKGNLEWLGGKDEPLDKFTNEVVLYLARGVAMWELYISPDILNEGEWDAIGQAMKWARDRFDILSTTEMFGGDPTKGQPYGYAHFKGSRGILAVRNPVMTPTSVKVPFADEMGLNSSGSSLVLERVYPDHWISPTLYREGQVADLPLSGYETAVYEIYPLKDCDEPLLAGAPFDVIGREGNKITFSVYGPRSAVRILNPEKLASHANLSGLPQSLKSESAARRSFTSDGARLSFDVSLDSPKLLALLLTPARTAPKSFAALVSVDGQVDTARSEPTEARSSWHTLKIPAGKHRCEVRIVSPESPRPWNVSAWLTGTESLAGSVLSLTAKKSFADRPMPPRPFPPNVFPKNVKLGDAHVSSSKEF